jgi:hypothetical protein
MHATREQGSVVVITVNFIPLWYGSYTFAYGYDVTIYRGKLLVTVSMVIKISGHTRACAVIRAYLCNTPE